MSAEEDIYNAMESAVIENLSPKEIWLILDEAYIEAIRDSSKMALRQWEELRRARAGQ